LIHIAVFTRIEVCLERHVDAESGRVGQRGVFDIALRDRDASAETTVIELDVVND
jgi:hypothetical protein